jgi:hypothetical integral membrane protein (TIGR02206 family)
VSTQFQLFGLPHLVILLLIPVTAAILVRWSRNNDARARNIRITLGCVILANELVWYWFFVREGWFEFPYTLPLHLCDIVLWLTVYTSFTAKQWSFEFIYYWGLAGTTMALLTPDISTPALSYLTLRFFVAHGGILVAVFFLVWRKLQRPRKGSFWRAWFVVQMYAVVVGLFNYFFQTNYFFLCEKPAEASLLNYLGPWPVYLLIGDAIALLLFWLLWLPFRRKPTTAGPHPE